MTIQLPFVLAAQNSCVFLERVGPSSFRAFDPPSELLLLTWSHSPDALSYSADWYLRDFSDLVVPLLTLKHRSF